MVQDDIVLVASPDAVFTVTGIRSLISQAETKETDNHVVGTDIRRIILQADAIAGGCLAGNGQVSFFNLQLRLQLNDPGHIEYNRAGARLLNRPAKGTLGTIIGQFGHMQHLTSAAAGGIHAATFGSGEGQGAHILLGSGNFEIGIFNGLRSRIRRRNAGTAGGSFQGR